MSYYHNKISLKAIWITLIFLAVPNLSMANNATWLFLGQTTSSIETEITSDLKATIDKVLEIVTDENLKKDKAARRLQLREAIDQRFNFRQMVIRSLARNWKKRTPQELEQFTELFKQLLERSYVNQIENYSGGKVEFKYREAVVKGDYALVKTEISTSGKPVLVDYKLILEDGNWQVYDFIINNVSMIRNYRSQFSKIITEQSFEALLERMRSPKKKATSEEDDKQAFNVNPDEGV